MRQDSAGRWRYSEVEWDAILASIPNSEKAILHRRDTEGVGASQVGWMNELELSANWFAVGDLKTFLDETKKNDELKRKLLDQILELTSQLRELTTQWVDNVCDKSSVVRTRDGRDAGIIVAIGHLGKFSDFFEYKLESLERDPPKHKSSRKLDVDVLIDQVLAHWQQAGGSLGRGNNKFSEPGGPCFRFCELVANPIMTAIGKSPLTPDQIDHRIRKAKSKKGLAFGVSSHGNSEI